MLQVISKMAESFRKNNSNETELFQNIENFEHSVKDCVDIQVQRNPFLIFLSYLGLVLRKGEYVFIWGHWVYFIA